MQARYFCPALRATNSNKHHIAIPTPHVSTSLDEPGNTLLVPKEAPLPPTLGGITKYYHQIIDAITKQNGTLVGENDTLRRDDTAKAAFPI